MARNVSKKLCKQMKQSRTYLDKVCFAMESYRKGKKVKKYGFKDLPEQRFNRYKAKNS